MRCLFCKEASHETKGVEHLIPESFGSKKLLLPKGLVCDKCNNYFARKVEGPVMSHPSMRNVRGWYQVPNKKGKMPSVLGYIAGTDVKVNMKLDKNKKLQIKAEKLSEQHIVDKFLEDMEVTGELLVRFIFAIIVIPSKEVLCSFFTPFD